MRKKQNLFFHIINFYSVQNTKKIPWNCIYLKISFEKYAVRNPKPQLSMQPSVEKRRFTSYMEN